MPITGHIEPGRVRGKRVKGLFTVVIEIGPDPFTGKRRRMRRSVRGRESDAQLVLASLLTELNKGTYVPPAEETVAGYLGEWFRSRRSSNLSPNTIISEQTYIERHIIPHIGALKLTQLEPLHIQRLYHRLHEGSQANQPLSAKTRCIARLIKH